MKEVGGYDGSVIFKPMSAEFSVSERWVAEEGST